MVITSIYLLSLLPKYILILPLQTQLSFSGMSLCPSNQCNLIRYNDKGRFVGLSATINYLHCLILTTIFQLLIVLHLSAFIILS